MNAQAASTSPFEIDVAPALRFYMEGLESWKEGYERFFQPGASNLAANQSQADAQHVAVQWPSFSTAWLQSLMQQQTELYQFYGKRMGRYIELAERIARCHNPAELGTAQLDFMSRTFTDYTQQGAKMVEAIGNAGRNAS